MAKDKDVGVVSDPSVLRALAHPLRVRLLATLREGGAATATELAKRLGTESGSTSYHLRVLAKHGFVEDASGQRRHPRERRWAAAHRLTAWSNIALAATAAGREAAALMRRRQVEVLIEDLARFDEALADLDPSWAGVSGIGDRVERLTPASVTEVWDRFYAHLGRSRGSRQRGARGPAGVNRGRGVPRRGAGVTSTPPRPAPSVVDPTRRYTLLSFLQWLPVGLMMVPMVLLLLERGFSLGEVAAIAGVSAVAVALLELPTGGLADAVGRRPVRVAPPWPTRRPC
jgi:DNA-binding transcriptional ArsR family regulator